MAKKSKKKKSGLLGTIAGYVRKNPVIPVLYWILYVLMILVMLAYFGMFEIQEHSVIFTGNLLHMAGIFLLTAVFFTVDSIIHREMMQLSSKAETRSEHHPGYEPESEKQEKQDNKNQKKSENPENSEIHEIPVKIEQYFRLNSFEQPANGVQDFMNSCYHNTFRITLPESMQGYEIPNEFRFFYLHFEFEDQAHSFLMDDVVQKLEFRLCPPEQSQNALLYYVRILYETQLDPKMRHSGESELSEFTIAIKLALNHNKIQEFSMEIPEDAVSFGQILKTRIGNLFFPDQKKNCSSSAPKCRTDFQDTTRLEPMFLYDNSEFVFYHHKEPRKYSPKIFCYYNFSMITCPVC
ncbi:MAG: hypothetical protein K2O42_10390, partial [Oscillospiraceae bacterium]|nr:hypothetical protein [Oscillospiraceae bacterium]